MSRRAIPAGCRVSNPEPGPLSDGGWRWVGREWAVDLDARGRAECIVAWPLGLTERQYRERARKAVARAEACFAADDEAAA